MRLKALLPGVFLFSATFSFALYFQYVNGGAYTDSVLEVFSFIGMFVLCFLILILFLAALAISDGRIMCCYGPCASNRETPTTPSGSWELTWEMIYFFAIVGFVALIALSVYIANEMVDEKKTDDPLQP